MATNGNEPIQIIHKQEGYDRGVKATLGLTKREYFAAMAMQGILSSDNWHKYETLAKQSVEAADSLINELNKEA